MSLNLVLFSPTGRIERFRLISIEIALLFFFFLLQLGLLVGLIVDACMSVNSFCWTSTRKLSTSLNKGKLLRNANEANGIRSAYFKCFLFNVHVT